MKEEAIKTGARTAHRDDKSVLHDCFSLIKCNYLNIKIIASCRQPLLLSRKKYKSSITTLCTIDFTHAA